ncbi:MAG TPA: hypothetical protein VI454_05370 [Verrucomicrobiae bacterium]|jgi:hypothetical protein
MQQNAVSITITTPQEADIMQKIDALRTAVDVFAVSLTDEQRARLFKLGPSRMAFDAKCNDYLHQRADLVPPGVSVPEYEKDGTAGDCIGRIRARLATVDSRLGDTQMLCGSDRMNVDLTFFNYLAFASRTGTAGADDIHDELAALYPGRGPGGTPPTPPPAP